MAQEVSYFAEDIIFREGPFVTVKLPIQEEAGNYRVEVAARSVPGSTRTPYKGEFVEYLGDGGSEVPAQGSKEEITKAVDSLNAAYWKKRETYFQKLKLHSRFRCECRDIRCHCAHSEGCDGVAVRVVDFNEGGERFRLCESCADYAVTLFNGDYLDYPYYPHELFEEVSHGLGK